MLKGTNFRACSETIDLPERNETIEGYAFNDFALS